MGAAMEIRIDMTRVDRAQEAWRQQARDVREASRAARDSGGGAARESASRERAARAEERASQQREREARASGPASRFRQASEARQAAYESGNRERVFDAEHNYRRAQTAYERAAGGGEARVNGPASRFQRAAEQRQRAYASGDEAQIFDAQHNYRRAEEAFERAQRGGRRTPAERLETFVRSTRFGNGVSPLVGRGLDLANMPKGVAGPLGLGLAAGAAGWSFARDAMNDARDRYGEIHAAARQGVSPGQIGALGRVGFRGEEAATQAEAFRQRLLSDPTAANVGLQGGIRARPGLAGAADAPRLLQQGIDLLRQTTDAEERLRKARALGLTDTLKYLDVSRQVDARLRRQADIEERMASGRGPRDANDLDVSLETFQRAKASARAGLASPFMRDATTLTNLGTSALQGGADFLNRPGVGRSVRNSILQQIPGGSLLGAGLDLLGGGSEKSETEKNTQALNRLNETIQQGSLGPGSFGAVGRRGGRMAEQQWTHDILSRGYEAAGIRNGEMPL